jgi:hypothetical protein
MASQMVYLKINIIRGDSRRSRRPASIGASRCATMMCPHDDNVRRVPSSMCDYNLTPEANSLWRMLIHAVKWQIDNPGAPREVFGGTAVSWCPEATAHQISLAWLQSRSYYFRSTQSIDGLWINLHKGEIHLQSMQCNMSSYGRTQATYGHASMSGGKKMSNKLIMYACARVYTDQQCIHIHVCHPREILHQADQAMPPLDLTKAKSIFNIQSMIFYDILCIWMSTLPFRSICSLIPVYLILNLI